MGPSSTASPGSLAQRGSLALADTLAAALGTSLETTVLVLLKLPRTWVEGLVRRVLTPRFAYLPGATDFLVSLVSGLQRRRDVLDPHVVKTFTRNLFAHEFVRGALPRHRMGKRTGGYAPQAMVVSPTMRCNLKCTGCYSAQYDTNDELTSAELDDVFRQCKALGIFFVVVSGGEPYLREDLLELFERHNDMLFMTYTNGTLLTRNGRARRLAELGNVVPCISVEGFQRETDERRGQGVHARILEAMAALRAEGVLFGFSATPTRSNNELMVSDEFIDYYVDQGCYVGWYFNYMPMGRDPDLDLMPTPEQREYRRQRVVALRREKPIVVADFWCDGALVDGCLSAGNEYFHVNSRGGIEPCVFNQFSLDNIRTTRLADAVDGPYFRYLRERLREMENKLRPCPISDRPQILRDACERFNPVCSQEGGRATVTTLADGLNDYARRLKAVMDPVWQREYGGHPEVGNDHHIERPPCAVLPLGEDAGAGGPAPAGGCPMAPACHGQKAS